VPISIPTFNDETHVLEDVDYYDADEIAGMMHVHAATVRRYCREGRWSCLRIGKSVYMTARMFGDAVESMTQHVDPRDPNPGQDSSPPAIGRALQPEDAEAIR